MNLVNQVDFAVLLAELVLVDATGAEFFPEGVGGVGVGVLHRLSSSLV